MKVRELLKKKSTGVVAVELTADTARAARLVMEHGVGGLPVVDGDGRLHGFVSEREIVGALYRDGQRAGGLAVASIMRKPAPVCGGDDVIPDVMRRMTRERLRHLVVVEEDRIAGVISVGDLVKHRLEELELETGVLRDYVMAQRAMK